MPMMTAAERAETAADIKKNGLQDQKNKRNINADAKLKAVFNGKATVTMFEMTKLVNKHIKA